MEKVTPETWGRVRAGDIIELHDLLTMAQNLTPQGTGCSSYIVERQLIVREQNGLAEWVFYTLVDSPLCVMMKIVDQEYEVRVYKEDPSFIKGNRRDQCERGEYWLFAPPENPDDFLFNSLIYTGQMKKILEGRQVVFSQKSQRELEGEYTEKPPRRGIDFPLLATLVEYQANQEVEYSEVMVLEVGPADDVEGGLITLLLGRTIFPHEVQIFHRS